MSVTVSDRTRAAASSSASGMPSSRATSSATAGASRSFSAKDGLCALRALDEQAHRRRSRQRLDAVAALGYRQRQDRVGLFAGNAQCLAARGEHAHLGRGAQDRVGQVCRRLDQVLAVVEDEQRRAAASGARTASGRAAGPGSSRTPSTCAASLTTSAGSRSGARSRNHAPSGNSAITSAATCSDSLVLPRPPMPSSVSSRAPERCALISSSSRSRPMNEVVCSGRLFGISLHRQPALAAAHDAVDLLAVGRRGERRIGVAHLEQLDRLGDALHDPVAVRLDAAGSSRRAPRAPRASAGSARRARSTSRAPRSAWRGPRPPAAWRRAQRLPRCSRAA